MAAAAGPRDAGAHGGPYTTAGTPGSGRGGTPAGFGTSAAARIPRANAAPGYAAGAAAPSPPRSPPQQQPHRSGEEAGEHGSDGADSSADPAVPSSASASLDPAALSEQITACGVVLLGRPTPIPLHDIPQRCLRRLTVAHSSTLSPVLLTHSQACLTPALLRELAYSRAMRGGVGVASLLSGVPLAASAAITAAPASSPAASSPFSLASLSLAATAAAGGASSSAATPTASSGAAGAAAGPVNPNDAPALLMLALGAVQAAQAAVATDAADAAMRRRDLSAAAGPASAADAAPAGRRRPQKQLSRASLASLASLGGISTYSALGSEGGLGEEEEDEEEGAGGSDSSDEDGIGSGRDEGLSGAAGTGPGTVPAAAFRARLLAGSGLSGKHVPPPPPPPPLPSAASAAARARQHTAPLPAASSTGPAKGSAAAARAAAAGTFVSAGASAAAASILSAAALPPSPAPARQRVVAAIMRGEEAAPAAAAPAVSFAVAAAGSAAARAGSAAGAGKGRRPRQSAVEEAFTAHRRFAAEHAAAAASRERMAAAAAERASAATALLRSVLASPHIACALLALPPTRLAGLGLEQLSALHARLRTHLGAYRKALAAAAAVRLQPASHPAVVGDALARCLAQPPPPSPEERDRLLAAQQAAQRRHAAEGAVPSAAAAAGEGASQRHPAFRAWGRAARTSRGAAAGAAALARSRDVRGRDPCGLLEAVRLPGSPAAAASVASAAASPSRPAASAPHQSQRLPRLFADAMLGSLAAGGTSAAAASAAVGVPARVHLASPPLSATLRSSQRGMAASSSPALRRARSPGAGEGAPAQDSPRTLVAAAVAIAGPAAEGAAETADPAAGASDASGPAGARSAPPLSVSSLSMHAYVVGLLREAAAEAAEDWSGAFPEPSPARSAAGSGRASPSSPHDHAGPQQRQQQPEPAAQQLPPTLSVRSLLASVVLPPSQQMLQPQYHARPLSPQPQARPILATPAGAVPPGARSPSPAATAPLAASPAQKLQTPGVASAVSPVVSKALDMAALDAGAIQRGGDASLHVRIADLQRQLADVRARNAALLSEQQAGASGGSQ
jgi:hypothetical protein